MVNYLMVLVPRDNYLNWILSLEQLKANKYGQIPFKPPRWRFHTCVIQDRGGILEKFPQHSASRSPPASCTFICWEIDVMS